MCIVYTSQCDNNACLSGSACFEARKENLQFIGLVWAPYDKYTHGRTNVKRT